jgi:hypothetical protein
MATRADEREEKRIEELAGETEITIGYEDDRKDLKEKRGVIKQTLYGGSKMLKHILPKGKRL